MIIQLPTPVLLTDMRLYDLMTAGYHSNNEHCCSINVIHITINYDQFIIIIVCHYIIMMRSVMVKSLLLLKCHNNMELC